VKKLTPFTNNCLDRGTKIIENIHNMTNGQFQCLDVNACEENGFKSHMKYFINLLQRGAPAAILSGFHMEHKSNMKENCINTYIYDEQFEVLLYKFTKRNEKYKPRYEYFCKMNLTSTDKKIKHYIYIIIYICMHTYSIWSFPGCLSDRPTKLVKYLKMSLIIYWKYTIVRLNKTQIPCSLSEKTPTQYVYNPVSFYFNRQ